MFRLGFIFSFGLGAGCAALAQMEPPVGIILSAESSSIQPKGVESEFAAAPGRALRPGDRLRTGTGTIRFAFCPEGTAQTLLPGKDLVIPSSHLPSSPNLFGNVERLQFCELPAAPQADASSVPAAPAETRGEKREILDMIHDAVLLQRRGDTVAAAEEYLQIASAYPDARWARGFGLRPGASSAGSLGGKTFALLIGISKYPADQPLGSLRYARADAQAFADFLISARGGSVPGDQIELLLDEKATRDGINAAVTNFVNKAAGKDNTLIIFVAAHGHYLTIEKEPKTGMEIGHGPYIVTADSYQQDQKTTGYPMADFRNLIAEQTTQFGRVIVYVDVCHAGYVRDPVSEQKLDGAIKDVFYDRQGNLGVMLAAEAKELAYEAAQFDGHGAFSYEVLKGLNGGAARPNAKVITFNDLYRFVLNGVGELTNNTQSPDKFVINPQMAVLDDATRSPGIVLHEATPLVQGATRRGGPKPQKPQKPDLSVPLLPSTEFEAAARRDPLAAISVYQRMVSNPAVPDEAKQQNARILRVALEEHGQQILITYLHGEQLPQTAGDFQLCGRYFDEALHLPEATTFDESRMWFCKGRALIFAHDEASYQNAVTLLERSIALDPDHAYAYNALGIAYLEQIPKHTDYQTYYDHAVAAFHDALRFAPDWAYPMHNMALAESERGNFVAARDAYRVAMRLAPQYSYLPYNLGLLNQRMNRLDEAQQLYQQALKQAECNRKSGLVPPVTPWRERADILNALGSVAAARRKDVQARQLYEQALQEDPQLAEAKYNLAILLSRNGPSATAVDLWRQNIASHQAEPASRLALADYLEKNKDRDGAIREYEAAVGITEKGVAADYVAARQKLAKLYTAANRWQDAYDQLTAARALSSQHPGIAEELGDAAAKLGRTSEAVDAFRDAGKFYTARSDRKRVDAKLSAIVKK